MVLYGEKVPSCVIWTFSMTRIACPHTAESNVAVFNAVLGKLGLAGVELRHHVRADLLDAAERATGQMRSSSPVRLWGRPLKSPRAPRPFRSCGLMLPWPVKP